MLWSPVTALLVTARRLRRLRLVAKAPALVKSVAARSSVALGPTAAVRSAVGASALRSDPRSTVVLRATAAASLALAVSELSLVAALVEATGFAASDAALCAWLFSSAFLLLM